jgi:hypothetical protein
MKTQILANGVSVIQSTTKSNSVGIIRHTDLGLSAYNQSVSNSEKGFITLNSAESWAPSYNLWTTTLDTVLPNTVIFEKQLIIDPDKVQGGENTPATVQQYLDIPKSLLITTMGSLDLQFSIQNQYTANVDSLGTPNYILSFTNPQYSPALNVGFKSTSLSTVNDLGIPQNTAPFIVGNASSLGTNYTIINAQFGALNENELGLLPGYDDNIYSNRGLVTPPSPLSGTAALCVRGSVSMVLDAAKVSGLSDDKFIGSKINKIWRGNYRYSAFSAIFKIREERFWDVYRPLSTDIASSLTRYNDRMQYEINMIPVTNDADSPDYGKFTVNIVVSSPASYNSTNLGCRWLVSISKFRNFVI